MATSERERWTNCQCPECGGWMRKYGNVKYGYLMCMDKCHDTMYLEEDFK